MTFLCLKCSDGTYSLNKNDEYCKECPENAICNENGSFIDTNLGYWRSNYFSNSIYLCNLEEACPQGDRCEVGYDGLLCDSCIWNENEQYYKSNSLRCLKCSEAKISMVLLALVILHIDFFFYIIQ